MTKARTQRATLDAGAEMDDLFQVASGTAIDKEAVWIDETLIDPNPYQPRRHFPRAALESLGNSMLNTTQIQSCVVRPHPDRPGRYQLASGDMRRQAAKLKDLTHLRCSVRRLNDWEMAVMAGEENRHRTDLSGLEWALHYLNLGRLILGVTEPINNLEDLQRGDAFPEKFPYKILSPHIGISERSLRRYLDLLTLPLWVLQRMDKAAPNNAKGKGAEDAKTVAWTEKHGRALLLLADDESLQKQLVQEIEAQALSGDAALDLVKLWRTDEDDSALSSAETQTTSGPKSDPRVTFSGSGTNSGISGSGAGNTAIPVSSGTGMSTRSVEIGTNTASKRPNVLQELIKPSGSMLAEAARLMRERKDERVNPADLEAELDVIQNQLRMLYDLNDKRRKK